LLVSPLSEELITAKAKENWLSYWKYYTKSSHVHCSEAHCLNHQEQAVLVSYKKEGINNIFVIPLCLEHSNNMTKQMEIYDEVDLIPIDLTL
jgi:hypothetical protein